MKSLFDLSHKEFWTVEEGENDRTWTALKIVLDKLGMQVVLNDAPFASGMLTESDYDILVLAAPTLPFLDKEVMEIVSFVRFGGGLLIVNDPDVLGKNGKGVDRWGSNPDNLTSKFGFYFKQFFGNQPRVIDKFVPHYIWNSVGELSVSSLCKIEVESLEQAIAYIPKFEEPCIVATHFGKGRVLAIGDGDVFADCFLREKENNQFAINVFNWLACKNPIEIIDVQIPSEVMLGANTKCSITIENVAENSLKSVNCELHIPKIPFQQPTATMLPHLPYQGSQTIEWSFKPRQPGTHHISLFIRTDGSGENQELLLNNIGEFSCQLPINLGLELRDEFGEKVYIYYTDRSFRAIATVNWPDESCRVPFSPILTVQQGVEVLCRCPEKTTEGTVDEYVWELQGNIEGFHPVICKFSDTNQQTWAHIWIKKSVQRQIQEIQRDYVALLDAEMMSHLSLIDSRFTSETIYDIPFRILQFEEYAELLYPSHTIEKIQEILYYIRKEDERNWFLLNSLISYVAPTFSANEKDGELIGVCIPCDPELTDKLICLYPGIRDDLLFNFLFSTSSTASEIKMTVASALAHEKYGHGFFSSFTKLGQQLAVLERHNLLYDVILEYLRSPYPRVLYEEYGEVIQMIADSSLIVNEGFAAWLELSLLERMNSDARLAIHQRRELIQKADLLRSLKKVEGGYFDLFSLDIPDDSQYMQGYSSLKGIAQKFGQQKAVEMTIEAADVDFGIIEVEGKAHFSMTASRIKEDICNESSVRSDYRLQAILQKLFKIDW